MQRSRFSNLVVVLFAALHLASAAPRPGPESAGDEVAAIRHLIEAVRGDEAEAASRRLLEARRSRFGDDSAEAAEAMSLAAQSLLVDGRFFDPECLRLAEEGLKISERRLGPDDPAVADSLAILAEIINEVGDIRQAKLHADRSLAIRQARFEPSHPAVAEGWYTLGLIGGQPMADRLRAAARAVAVFEANLEPDDPRLGRALLSLGRRESQSGNLDRGRALLERALANSQVNFGENSRRTAVALHAYAYSAREQGDLVLARDLLTRALRIGEKTMADDAPHLQTFRSQLGTVLADTGDLAGAAEVFVLELAAREKMYGRESLAAALVASRLGTTYLMMGDFARARPLMERALAVEENSGLHESWNLLADLNNLGFLLVNMGDYAAARPLLERAVAQAERIMGENRDHADVIGSLADLEALTGRTTQARALYEKVQRMRLAALGPDHPDTARSYLSLARLDVLTGQPGAALEKALEAETIARASFQSTARHLTDREALRYEGIRTSGLDLVLSVLVAQRPEERDGGLVRRVWNEVALSRAMVLDEMASRRRAAAARPTAEVQALTTSLDKARRRLARLTLQGPEGPAAAGFAAELRAARDEEASAERALSERATTYREERARGRIDLDAAQRALPPDTAVVGFLHYRHLSPEPAEKTLVLKRATGNRDYHPPEVASYLALVLPPGAAEPRLIPLGSAAAVDALVAAWRTEAAAPQRRLLAAGAEAEARYRRAGAALRRAVWDPLSAALGGAAQQVFIVPDGMLSLVNFAALPDRDDRYLVEKPPLLHYLSAERDAVDVRAARTGRGVFVLGDPDYDARAPHAAPTPAAPVQPAAAALDRGGACAELNSRRFGRLPYARQEARDVAALWRKRALEPPAPDLEAEDVRLLLGGQATETAFRLAAPGRRLVHLATHGFVAGDACASSLGTLRGARAGAPVPGGEILGQIGADPLLLTGLVLAGANRREGPPDADDGILTAAEVAALDLSGIEWMVLSACETGIGSVQSGEGVVGLRRAFAIAGVRTTIMSLWSVDDASTSEWMNRLYAARIDGRTTPEAVRAAGVAMIAARRSAGRSTHPFHWGAFVAAGDWR